MKLVLFNPTAFRAVLFATCIAAANLNHPTSGQGPQLTPTAETAPPTAEILRRLGERDPEGALEILGMVVDQPLSIGEIAYSGLPAAAAGLHRSLSQLSSDEQFDLLEKWTLPDAGRIEVRLLAVPVPTDAPPKVFARALGQRPRDSSFSVAAVGPVRGFFCSGWMLVKAADDLGRLARLRSTLDELAKTDVAGSQELLMLTHLAGSRGDLQRVHAYLKMLTAAGEDGADGLTPADMTKAAVASAALLHQTLQPLSESFLQRLVDQGGHGKSIALRPFLRIAHATAVQLHRGESSPEVLWKHPLRHWIPATVRTARDIDRGQPAAVWLTHEKHVLHLAGGTTDVLFCRFPIVGEFDFVCETQEGGAIGTDGGLVYGGLHFQALGRKNTLQVWDPDMNHAVTKPSTFARHDIRPVFNRVSIRSTEEGAKFESNFHPIWFDGPAAQSSPWLGLRSSGTKRPVFRNLRLSGRPTIPREVRLTSGDQLRGWQSGFFGETQPGFHHDLDSAEQTDLNFDWQLRSGELIAAKREDSDKPGLLQYQRPLLSGEAITYQFLHQGEQSVVHPSIGRLAFLLESGGVRVRWITTGELEWTSLPADNAALEPLNRRGPRPLPMREGEWNTVRIELTDNKVLVKLNEELIYQRPLDAGGETQFGLYRATRTAESRVRQVVMTGDWPETLPDGFLRQLIAHVSVPSLISVAIPSQG